MKIRIRSGLLMTPATLTNGGQRITLDNVVIDTGSVATVFATHKLVPIGIAPLPGDTFHRVAGIGGWEYVLDKKLDGLSVGNLLVSSFGIEIGAMDYGFALDGILGLDFLLAVEAVIDLDQMELRSVAGA